MTESTLEALNKSIDKWERLASNGYDEETRITAKECPLCRRFRKNGVLRCWLCPVYEKTKRSLCQGTPYEDAVLFLHYKRDDFRRAARDEVDFLRSLLPALNQ